MKKGFILREVAILMLILSCNFEIVSARHKCPKVPSPPGIMGIFSSTTLIPSGSVMADARSSETLGCDRGHPSDNFINLRKNGSQYTLKTICNMYSKKVQEVKDSIWKLFH